MGAAAERVARVTVRGARGDPAATRGRLDLALGGVTLAPASLPPAAVLLVRRVADPLPGAALDPRRRTAWAAAARARMEELARGAARPAAEVVPAGAEAVVFTDLAELLACLARDWTAGVTASKWWWRAWARRARPGGPAPDAPAAWAAEPRAVPAAAARLAEERALVGFLARVGEEERERLETAVRRAWHLPPRAAAPPPAAPVVSPGSREAEPVASPVATPPARRSPGAAATRSPAAPSAPSATAPVRTGAAATHAPAKAEAPAITRLARLLLAVHADPVAARESRAAGPAPPAAPGQDLAAATPAPRVVEPPGGSRTSPPAREEEQETSLEEPGHHAPPRGAPSPREEVRDEPEWTVAEARRGLPPAVRSRLAGAFHLVPLAQLLGLYPDFTRPRDPGLPLPLFAWLELTIAHLLRPVRPEERRDPLWPLLAALAGRDPEAPASAAPLGPEEQRGAARLAVIARRCRRRLVAVLGPDAVDLTLRRSGLVHHSAARVDVTFALDDLPIELRLAGLDRDPGWLPSAGLDLFFHFT
jgi:hypothetical protein